MKKSIITALFALLCFSAAWAQNGIAETFWRDVNTGDWVLGIMKDAVIYDCKVWDISSMDVKKDAFDINAKNEGNELTIKIGKAKNAQRIITIGKQKMVCEAMNTAFVPDYPTKDENPNIADNNFQEGDSVTISGWMINMPQQAKEMGEEFEVNFPCLYNDEDASYSTKIDAEGRFTLRFPIDNSTTIYAERGRGPVIFPVEPHETYFVLKDFNGKCYVMGRNARLQNECLLALLTRQVEFERGNYQRAKEYGGFEENRVHLDGLKDAGMAKVEKYFAEHPNISERFKTYMRNEVYTEIGSNMLQMRFSLSRQMTVPDDYLDFVIENYWNKIQEPKSVNSSFGTFFRDYYDCIERRELSTVGNHLRWGFYEGEKDGIVNFTAEDKKLFEDYLAGLKEFETRLFAAPEADRQAMIDEYNASDIIKQVNAMVEREDVKEGLNQELNLMGYKLMKHAADSLGWSKALYGIFLSQSLYKFVDGSREPLRQYTLDYGDKYITSDAAKKMLHEMSDRYLAISKRQFNESILKSNDDVAGLSEGGQIIKKLMEPHRGHYVLVDFWGTWCSPCKEALSHSQEEYDRLAPYDMVFMYLANRSDDEGWKNVIKQYNVTGENVVHYNLPRDQQTLVEKYLKVNKFPSYYLFDKEGNLMDVNADPRDLDAFENLMKKLSE